jgi:DNA-binding MarR family transcriptional regulator
MPASPPDAAGATELSTQAQTVLRQFRVLFSAVRSHFAHIEKLTGVGGAQVWALSLVQSHPGMGVGELARAMDIHQSTASNLVKSLITRGLMSSARSGADRRAVQLSVTAQAGPLLNKVRGPIQGVLPDALERMDPAALHRLHQELQGLIALLGDEVDTSAANRPLADM